MSLIHFVATHFSPFTTGQLPWREVCKYYNQAKITTYIISMELDLCLSTYPHFFISLQEERVNAMSKQGGRMLLPDPLFHLGIGNRTKGRLLVLASPSDRCSSRNHILGSYLTHSADDSHLTSSAIYGISKFSDIYIG